MTDNKEAALGAANTESSTAGIETTRPIPTSNYDTRAGAGQVRKADNEQVENFELFRAATHAVIDTLTGDEEKILYGTLYDVARDEDYTLVYPYDYLRDNETLRDLSGGVVVSIAPMGNEDALSVIIRTADNSLVEVEGWADIYQDRVEDTRFDITRTDVIKHGTITARQIDAFATELLKIIRGRADALRRLEEVLQ